MLVNFVKSHRIDDAWKLFDEMPQRDCISFTTIIMGLAQNELPAEALSLFRDMVACGVKPNEVTLATVLSSLAHLRRSLLCPYDYLVAAGEMVHAVARKTRLDAFVLVGTNLVNWYAVASNLECSEAVFEEMPEKNTVTWNAMLNGYAKAGLIDLARDVFDRIPVRDVVSWSTIIDAYLRMGMFVKAMLGYREMLRQDPDSRPNEVMLVDLVSACSRCSALQEGSQLHVVTIKAGFDRHPFVQATLIHFYAACKEIGLACVLFRSCDRTNISCWNSLLAGFTRNGMAEEACSLFQEMPERDVVTWSSMISGYIQFDRSHQALALSCEMMRQNGVKPNEITLASILSAVASCGTLEQGKSVYGYIIKSTDSIPLTENLMAAAIDMYAKGGSIDNALRVFSYHQNAPSLSTVSPWNALISGLAKHGHADTCLKVFSDMQARGDVKPNAITFLAVLSACCHAGLVADGREHFKSMTSVYGMRPSIKHYGCMVDLLGRAGCLEEAERLVMGMPMEADVVIWGSMLANARTHGNMEMGKRAAERLARLEPSHGGGRVLLSNIYADAGRWEDVFVVRREMQEERLIKLPGCSGIL